MPTDGPKTRPAEAASAALALIEGALLLARVSGQATHLDNAKRGSVCHVRRPAHEPSQADPVSASAVTGTSTLSAFVLETELS